MFCVVYLVTHVVDINDVTMAARTAKTTFDIEIHLFFDESHFRYVAQEGYNCHQNQKVANCFDRRFV